MHIKWKSSGVYSTQERCTQLKKDNETVMCWDELNVILRFLEVWIQRGFELRDFIIKQKIIICEL